MRSSGYYRQFDFFDPINEELPEYPFSQLPSIAYRARKILRGRSLDQIKSAASTIDWFIDEYFDNAKDILVRQILEKGSYELGYLRYEDRNEKGVNELLDNWPSGADEPAPFIPSRENTSSFEALSECIDSYVIEDDADFPNAKQYEYFAVLSLWHLADCIIRHRDIRTHDDHLTDQMRQLEESLRKLPLYNSPEIRLSLAGESAVSSMEAICWAERLQFVDVLGFSITRLANELKAERAKTDMLLAAQRDTDELATQKAIKTISVNASKAAIARHAENRAMKSDVFEWCKEHLQEYPSMDKAAEAIAGGGKLVPVAVRTARDWIGEWAKLNGRPARKA